jgi:ABC-type transport system involved in cytochrome c biogenesis ATPase subunit
LAADTRVDFTYPISALVGANGTNKSSILRALYGAPGHNNLGNFWFSTSTDPITETGSGPSCFIYGHWNDATQQVVEVLKTRVSKEDDPDYWEPSRPIIRYGMDRMPPVGTGEPMADGRSMTRWNAISKNVVYLDFRAALSAFDKFFYHGELRTKTNTEKNKKDFIRIRAPHLKRALDTGMKTLEYRKSERLHGGVNRTLLPDELAAVSAILGREYSEIKIIRHSLFNCDAFSCFMTTVGLKYTEAFAGSGEFAVVRIVTSIMEAPDQSLVLLDEPEVSLHPGAQDRLLDFLTTSVKMHKHQVVISTHSPAIVRKLPPEAIKVLTMDSLAGKVRLPRQASLPDEAFFHLGEPMPGKIFVVVEDALAQAIVKRALSTEGEAISELFDVQYFPGGSQTLWGHYLPIYAAEARVNVLVLFDGDQRPAKNFQDPTTIAVADEATVKTEILRVTKVDIQFHVDGGKTGANIAQQEEMRRRFVSWALKNVDYLPGSEIPEAFVWQNMQKADKVATILDADAKKRFENLTRIELGTPTFEAVTSDEIFATQRRCLATIPVDHPDLIALKTRLLAFAQERGEKHKKAA